MTRERIDEKYTDEERAELSQGVQNLQALMAKYGANTIGDLYRAIAAERAGGGAE
ncbi:hypothetical protein [Pseudoclavibacter sp. CFCC 13611]|uniref:hypothetical protein n=1 Tax=Pseudoclavibacter sp. CFCC 13611 TaxID=2615178 RepID=UPI001787A34C|nr:hypothetical protein [Pseudoclavibacter sp. CFCC 13611]